MTNDNIILTKFKHVHNIGPKIKFAGGPEILNYATYSWSHIIKEKLAIDAATCLLTTLSRMNTKLFQLLSYSTTAGTY